MPITILPNTTDYNRQLNYRLAAKLRKADNERREKGGYLSPSEIAEKDASERGRFFESTESVANIDKFSAQRLFENSQAVYFSKVNFYDAFKILEVETIVKLCGVAEYIAKVGYQKFIVIHLDFIKISDELTYCKIQSTKL